MRTVGEGGTARDRVEDVTEKTLSGDDLLARAVAGEDGGGECGAPIEENE